MDLLAAHLAHWLVKEGMPFRQAHHTTGKVVAMAESKNIQLNELSLEDRANIRYFYIIFNKKSNMHIIFFLCFK